MFCEEEGVCRREEETDFQCSHHASTCDVSLNKTLLQKKYRSRVFDACNHSNTYVTSLIARTFDAEIFFGCYKQNKAKSMTTFTCVT